MLLLFDESTRKKPGPIEEITQHKDIVSVRVYYYGSLTFLPPFSPQSYLLAHQDWVVFLSNSKYTNYR